jgi:glutathione reductase (NADPH)
VALETSKEFSIMQTFDLIVIGSGTAGSAVASTCRSAGWTVAVVDSLPFGGTCALRGCDPKKVLVGIADLIDWSRRIRDKRAVKGELLIDWPELIRFKRSFTDPVPKYKEQEFEEAGIKSIHGRARFADRTTIEVGKDRLQARHIVIASGARPATLNIPGEEHLINSTQFLELEQLPKEIVFVGGGYIAMEFTHIAARAGSRVHVLHRGERILEKFDGDLVAKLVERTEELGVVLHTTTAVEAVEKTRDRLTVHASQKGEKVSVDCDLAVHAAGRVPDIDDLDLETAGVKREKDGVAINEYLQSVSNLAVYAGGDSAAKSGPPLTPVADYDGKVIAANLLRGNHVKTDYRAIPTVVFTIPPLAAVGLTEEAATQKGLSFRKNHSEIGSWYSSRRVAEKTAAFKVLLDEGSNQILGAHLLGPAAEETINLFTMAMRLGISSQQLNEIIFAYPTHASEMQYMV